MSVMTRRRLLQALTVGAGSLAFGAERFGELRSARADVPGKPRRMIIVPIVNGSGVDSNRANWAKLGGSTTDFALGPILQPFADKGLKDQLVCVENIEFKRTPGSDTAEQHWAGTAQMLTGSTPVNKSVATNISIDQYAAQKIGAGMAWPSLYMATCHSQTSCSTLGNGSNVAANADPLDVFNKVFGNLMAGGPSAATLRRLARRQSVLDLVSKDLGAFVSRLPLEDRMRAEAQLSAIQTLEVQLKAQSMGGNSCSKPMIPMGVDYSVDQSLPETMRAFIDITVAAMACDQTRVVLMHNFLSDDNYYFKCPYDPVNSGEAHHGLSHGTNDPTGEKWLAERQFQHLLVAELADKLNQIPEAGGTMLDNTVIFMPNEVGAYPTSHSPAGMQWLTIGGKGLGIRTGQYLQVAPTPTQYDEVGTGMAAQRMLVSLLQALGLPDQTFGDEPSINTGSGPLPGYFA